MAKEVIYSSKGNRDSQRGLELIDLQVWCFIEALSAQHLCSLHSQWIYLQIKPEQDF